MDMKKRTTVLVIVALILATTAIAMNVASSNEVSSDPLDLQVNAGSGQIGVEVLPTEGIEDKMTEDPLA